MKKLKAVIQKLINRFLNRRDRGEVHYINGYEILPAPLKKDEEREIFERIEAGDRPPEKPARSAAKPGYNVQHHDDALSDIQRAAIRRMLENGEE